MEPPRCTKAPRCQLRKGHDGDCGGTAALLMAVATTQGAHVVDWLARRAIKLLGGTP